MREYREVRRQTPDPEAAAPYLGYARELLGQMKAEMDRGGIDQLSRTKHLPDGAVVTVRSRFGHDTINIQTPRQAPRRPGIQEIPSEVRDVMGVEPVEPHSISVPTSNGGVFPISAPVINAPAPAPPILSPQPVMEDLDVEIPTTEPEELPTREPDAEPREKYTYEKTSACSLGRNRVATSPPFYATNSFFFETAQMSDQSAVYYVEAWKDGSPATLYVLDGGTMNIANSIVLGDLDTQAALVTASRSPPRVIVFDMHRIGFSSAYTNNIRSINMATGGAAVLSVNKETNFTPVVPLQPAGGAGMVLAFRGNAQITELLDASSLVAANSTNGETDPTSGFWLTALDVSQAYFAENGVFAVFHLYTTKTIEVRDLSTGGAFSVVAPIAADTAVQMYIAVMRDKKTIYMYAANKNDLRVYKSGAWSGNIVPSQATPGFKLLYDPVSDTVALGPTQQTNFGAASGSMAWFFGAKDCMGEPMGVFHIDVSVGGASPTYSDQFLGGALITQTEELIPEADRPVRDAAFRRRITKHTIGKLQQARMDSYAQVSEDGTQTPIGRAEYIAGGGT